MDIRLKRKIFRQIKYFTSSELKFPAVDEVTISISDKPIIYTIAGESGYGKTTLAKIFLRILKPDKGEILYRGKNI